MQHLDVRHSEYAQQQLDEKLTEIERKVLQHRAQVGEAERVRGVPGRGQRAQGVDPTRAPLRAWRIRGERHAGLGRGQAGCPKDHGRAVTGLCRLQVALRVHAAA